MTDTAAVALNFYQEDMTPWHPRVNQRGATDGVTGMELPLYNYSVALLYHLTAPEHAAARLFSMMCGAAALLFLYLIAARLFDERTAVSSAAAMSLSPLFAFYSSKIMPDILMLALWLGAIRSDSLKCTIASLCFPAPPSVAPSNPITNLL